MYTRMVLEKSVLTVMFPVQRQEEAAAGPTQDPISASLGLVSDADSIRENIVDEFSCEGRG